MLVILAVVIALRSSCFPSTVAVDCAKKKKKTAQSSLIYLYRGLQSDFDMSVPPCGLCGNRFREDHVNIWQTNLVQTPLFGSSS